MRKIISEKFFSYVMMNGKISSAGGESAAWGLSDAQPTL